MANQGLLSLQTLIGKTASFNSASLDMGNPSSTADRPMWARIVYYNALNASGSNTAQFSIQDSDDNSTFYDRALARPITLTTTAKRGSQFIPILNTTQYIRLALVISGGGSGPSIWYQAGIGPGKS